MPLTSWLIMNHLLLVDEQTQANPIFQRELTRPPIWQVATEWILRATGTLLVVSGITCYLSVLLVFYLQNFLVLLIPIFGLWGLVLTITLAPTVAQERDRQTWDTLRTVPLSLSEVVLGKAGGALWWLRSLLRLLMSLLVIVAVIMGMVSLFFTSASLENMSLDVPPSVLCLGALVIPFVVACMFIIDRVQFFVLSALAVLAASASTSNIRSAIATGLGVLFAVWLADVGVAALLLRLKPGPGLGSDLLSVAALGPLAGYLGRFDNNMVVLAGVFNIILREGAIMLIWRWTLRAAQRD